MEHCKYCGLSKEAYDDMYEALEAIINSETISNRENFNNALHALAKAKPTTQAQTEN